MNYNGLAKLLGVFTEKTVGTESGTLILLDKGLNHLKDMKH